MSVFNLSDHWLKTLLLQRTKRKVERDVFCTRSFRTRYDLTIVNYPSVTLACQICSAAGQWHQGLFEEEVLTTEAGRKEGPALCLELPDLDSKPYDLWKSLSFTSQVPYLSNGCNGRLVARRY